MKGFFGWFAANGVFANLLLLVIVVSGLVTLPTITREVFPEIATDLVRVTVEYPGAAPEEVEQSVILRVEEAVEGIEGIEEITSIAAENIGVVTVEALEGADIERLLDDVKGRVDAIDTFPREAEEPVIEEVLTRRQVVSVAISGDVREKTIKKIAEQVRDDLLALEDVTQVTLQAVRPYEISIEVSRRDLRRYGLTFEDVARVVRAYSLDLPAGEIETEGGQILVRTAEQGETRADFSKIPVRVRDDGTRVLVEDVATVVDGFADTDQAAAFDGESTAIVQVFRVGDQSALDISDQVAEYVKEQRDELPKGVSITIWQDESETLRARLDLLISNGQMGFLLVAALLALFLRLYLASWVAAGVPLSFLGAIILMPGLDVTISLISLFGFIVVLGIVVDDAIVVGENIFRHFEMGKDGLTAATDGSSEVAKPVFFAVATTVVAFVPLLIVSGTLGKIIRAIPLIVISALAFSLIESFFILPNHLSHMKHHKKRRGLLEKWGRVQASVSRGLDWIIDRMYEPTLALAKRWRYATIAVFASMLMVSIGLVLGRWVEFTFFPDVEADQVSAFLTMPQGTPEPRTRAAVRRMEDAAQAVRREVKEETGQDVFRHVLASIGQSPARVEGGPEAGKELMPTGSHIGEVTVELVGADKREITSEEIVRRWRARVGTIPSATELTYQASVFTTGDPIAIRISGPDIETLEEAADRLKRALADYPGVEEIADSYLEGKQELSIEITEEAEAAGLTLQMVASQVRGAFYGAEAQRIPREREEVKVMVRLPEEERQSVADLEDLYIRGPGEVAIPFGTAGRAQLGRGPSSIKRVDAARVIEVTADVDRAKTNANEVIGDLSRTVLPELRTEYPRLRFSFFGEQEEQQRSINSLTRGFMLALFIMFALLAIALRAYIQPLIVMSAIPFGFVGALGGHLLMGLDVTILSLFGVVALAGVVVNDSLVMVDFINRYVADQDTNLDEAIRAAGKARFRPILLTSLTTFAGLSPLLLEQSVQAQFLIPMATSLAFGVLFGTLITLVLVPVLYNIVADVKKVGRRATKRTE